MKHIASGSRRNQTDRPGRRSHAGDDDGAGQSLPVTPIRAVSLAGGIFLNIGRPALAQ